MMIRHGETDGTQARADAPNEAEAEAMLQQAIAEFGRDSAAAACARRHLRIIRRFNQHYGWAA